MTKIKQSLMVFLLIFTLFSSTGCTNNWEENLQSVEDFINQIEERGNEFFNNLGNGVKEIMEDLFEKEKPLDDNIETPSDQGFDALEFEDIKFVTLAMREAYLDLPINYAYDFDVEGKVYLLEELNKYRGEYDLPPLERRDDLAQSSRYKSLAMLQYDYFSHDNPNFKGEPFDYLFWNVLDLKYSSIGENLAFVAKQSFINKIEAEELLEGWKNSPSHNAQMLTKDHKYVGIGVVRAKETGAYYKGYKALIGTQHFGY